VPNRQAWLRWTAALAVGTAAGYACMLLRTPIPWMLGPLFSLALLRVLGADVAAPFPARYVGQWIIGTSLGLYFTPVVVHEVAGLWYLLVAGAAFAVALGYVSGIALARLADLDRTTGIFASVPGGAAEMATLGERFGGRVDRIAAAQSLRILIVVAIVPGAITALDIHGSEPYVQGASAFDAGGFALLMAATLVLGNAPGGIAEMCITAKVLQLGVPLVTAFHVTRLVVLLLATPAVFVHARRWHRAWEARRSG
jgi:membrane AbrB-like protein